MGIKLIIKCTKCANLLIASAEQKTRTCPYCSATVNLQKSQRIASASNAYEASEILKELKKQKGFKIA
jgi:acetyl-CoA carboxylase beta subunit